MWRAHIGTCVQTFRPDNWINNWITCTSLEIYRMTRMIFLSLGLCAHIDPYLTYHHCYIIVVVLLLILLWLLVLLVPLLSLLCQICLGLPRRRGGRVSTESEPPEEGEFCGIPSRKRFPIRLISARARKGIHLLIFKKITLS